VIPMAAYFLVLGLELFDCVLFDSMIVLFL
jgi:hypothetical protein